MAKDDIYYERLGKYNSAGFSCAVDDTFLSKKKDKERFEAAKDALKAVGVDLSYNDGRLSMRMDSEMYLNVATRKAGPKSKKILSPSYQDNKGHTMYYSDVLIMMQNMSDAEIIRELKVPKATYYRHKKAMLESEYYKELDKTRLDDEEYLKEAIFDGKF